jgi:hypothetical protein
MFVLYVTRGNYFVIKARFGKLEALFKSIKRNNIISLEIYFKIYKYEKNYFLDFCTLWIPPNASTNLYC